MLASLALLLISAASLVQGAVVQPRAVPCPDLSPCGATSPTSDSDATGTRCSYVRSGPVFRCFYNNAGDLVPTPPGTTETSDAACPALNTGTCAAPPPTTTSISIVPSGTSLPTSTPSTISPPIQYGRRIFPNRNYNKCLDVRGAVYANGTPVQIYDCNWTPAQEWIWNEGSTKIQLANTNFCLDAGSNPASGIGMKIWQCYPGLPAQQFYRTGDKRFAVEGKGQCLDLTDGRLDNSVQSQTWKCTDRNTNQIWTE
ncbi:ricin B lectin domain-containing protein [Mrakia frigida]|uniref:ricin B lectin domain-containing protein n=1 Tax=Mrakia frigida TaxID=29902 RepID=UPI003FCC188C